MVRTNRGRLQTKIEETMSHSKRMKGERLNPHAGFIPKVIPHRLFSITSGNPRGPRNSQS